MENAWHMTCTNSIKMGNYTTSNGGRYLSTRELDPTGSREICGFYDSDNTCKMLALNTIYEEESIVHPDDVEEYWIGGGCFLSSSTESPLLSFKLSENPDEILWTAVGWGVLNKPSIYDIY